MCIRLEDPYITNKKQIKTETFITELFEKLNINLMRIKTNEDFNIYYLENELRKILSHPAYE